MASADSDTTALLDELREAATRGINIRTDYLTGHPSYMPLTMAARSADEIERLLAEIARLRPDPNRLDLASVPATHEFIDLSRLMDGTLEVTLRAAPYIGGEADIIGTGPTPAAALADAVGRCG